MSLRTSKREIKELICNSTRLGLARFSVRGIGGRNKRNVDANDGLCMVNGKCAKGTNVRMDFDHFRRFFLVYFSFSLARGMHTEKPYNDRESVQRSTSAGMSMQMMVYGSCS